MQREIEQKYRLSDPSALRARLRAAGAERRGSVLETNHIFDTPDRRTLRAGCGLRLREAFDLESGERGAATLTFKGPVEPAAMKVREEIETDVDDAAQLGAILERLGFSEIIRFEKRRETWLLGEVEITVDEMPRLGYFVEIESDSEQRVADAAAALGLSPQDIVRQSYVSMAANAGAIVDGAAAILEFAGNGVK